MMIYMENVMLDTIALLSEDKNFKGEKFQKLCNHSIDLISKVMDVNYYDGRSAFGKTMLLTDIFVTALRGVNRERRDIKSRERIVSKVFSIPKDQITGDFSAFISSNTCFPVYVSDFQYDASVSKSRLASLKMLFGDADLRKLHNFEYLNSLKVVMGNVYTSFATNSDGLSNLEVVTGDLHLENFDKVPNLENLSYLGGHIYMGNSVLSLDEIKSSNKEFVK